MKSRFFIEPMPTGSSSSSPLICWHGLPSRRWQQPRKVPLGWLKSDWRQTAEGVRENDWKKAASSAGRLYLRVVLSYGLVGVAAGAQAVHAWVRARKSGIPVVPVGKSAA